MSSPRKPSEIASDYVDNPFVAVEEFQKLVDWFDKLFNTPFGEPIMPEDVHGCIPAQEVGFVAQSLFSFSIEEFCEAAEFAALERPEFFSRIDTVALRTWNEAMQDDRLQLPADETGSYAHRDLFEDLYLKTCAVRCNLRSFSNFVDFKWIRHQRKLDADNAQRAGNGSIESAPSAALGDSKNGGKSVLTRNDPEARDYMDKGEWCTAAYAVTKHGFPDNTVSKAHTVGAYGCHIDGPRVAKTGTKSRYVYLRADLRRLANAYDKFMNPDEG